MKTLMLVSAMAVVLSGCFTRESANVYGGQEAGREQTVRMATVDSVRRVTIQGKPSAVGAVAGGATGGIAGSTVGQGKGSNVASILGAVAGGVAGKAIEEKVTSKEGLEITVRLDNGELRAIVQEADVDLKPGQRVRLLTSGGVTRVTP